MLHRIYDSGWFKTTVGHTVCTARIPIYAIFGPLGGLHELPIRGRIIIIYQVAGSLPAQNVAGRIAPGRTFVMLAARQKVQIQTAVVESPVFVLSDFEKAPKQRVGAIASQKMFLVRSRLIVEARRDGHPFDAQRG